MKGIISRICWLLFVNTTFKLAAPPWLKVHVVLMVPHAYNLVNGHCVFIEFRLTPSVLLLAGVYTPLPKGWCPETSQTQQNKKIQAEGRHRYRNHHTLLLGHKWWLGGIIFVFLYSISIHCFFRKILLVRPLKSKLLCIKKPKKLIWKKDFFFTEEMCLNSNICFIYSQNATISVCFYGDMSSFEFGVFALVSTAYCVTVTWVSVEVARQFQRRAMRK